MVDVRNAYQQFRDAGAEVVAVTMGKVEQVAAFRDYLKLPFPCLADPERTAYRQFEVPRGSVRQVAGLRVWGPAIKALARGGIGMIVGDPRQLQATFVIDSNGGVRFTHLPDSSADRPSNEVLLREVGEIVAGDAVT